MAFLPSHTVKVDILMSEYPGIWMLSSNCLESGGSQCYFPGQKASRIGVHVLQFPRIPKIAGTLCVPFPLAPLETGTVCCPDVCGCPAVSLWQSSPWPSAALCHVPKPTCQKIAQALLAGASCLVRFSSLHHSVGLPCHGFLPGEVI